MPAVAAAISADPRRPVLIDLIGRLVQGVTEGAARYAAAAGQADGALRRDLESLGRAKEAQAAELGPLAQALGVAVGFPEPGPPTSSHPAWGVILGEAFQAERALERLAGELRVLAPEPSLRALAGRLAGEAAQQGGGVRKLYLRYT